MMNKVLIENLGNFAIAYIDDVLIYSLDLKSHINHVRLVLKKLPQNKFFVKGEMCEFHTEEISFLGYNIMTTGIAMEKRKCLLCLNGHILPLLKNYNAS